MIRAAGGVVTRHTGGDREFLIIHRPRYDDWSIPKGKLDAGEKYADAAAREIKEETGSDGVPISKLGSIAYASAARGQKVVRYWLFEHQAGKFRANSEVDEVRWITAAEAARMLTYPRDRNVFAWAATLADSPRAGRVHLVRHAKAGDRSAWKKRDDIRPLTRAGRRQAKRIASALTTTPVSRILSSRYTRCTQTLQPLSLAIGEKIRTESRLAEGAKAGDLVNALGELEGRAVVMSSHGDEITALVEAVAASGAHLEPGPDIETAKGGTWDLHLTGGRVTTGRYIPPPG